MTDPSGGSPVNNPHWRRRLLDAYHLPVAAFLLYYGVATLSGHRGPRAIELTLPTWLAWAWSVALIVGALLVVYGVATDRSRAESSGHGFHLFGLGLFALANAAALDLGAVVLVFVFAAVATMRFGFLARTRAAQREAIRFLRGER